ncbi:MAG: serine/threonine-protein kinase, partial [Planctomycetota bacterium]
MTPDPHATWLATEFLKRLRHDEERHARRPLADYLKDYPGHEDLIAREYVLASDDGPRPGDDAADQCIGPFRLLRELGHGGQGAVHLAEDTRLGRQVALKVLRAGGDHASRLRFVREAHAAARLHHPAIATVLETGTHDGVAWLAVQYVPGPSLAGRLLDVGRLPLREAAELVARMAEALEVAHRAGLVHRDVKPANVLLGPDGPVILDFGLAHDRTRDEPTLTSPGDLCGTPAYMAPEQIAGRQTVDARIDVWALGVVLFECVTGSLPFAAPTQQGVCHAVLHHVLTIPARLPR